MSAATSQLAPCHLYHLYDAAGQLLYVGMTGDVEARLRSHEGSKPWWAEVDHRWVVTYPSRAACAAAEALAIHLLRPPYNTVVATAARCVVLAGRAAVEDLPPVDVVVEVEEQRRRAVRAERRVKLLERAVGRLERRITVRDSKLHDLTCEIRRGHPELHQILNLHSGAAAALDNYRDLHVALRQMRGRMSDIISGRPLSTPRAFLRRSQEWTLPVGSADHDLFASEPLTRRTGSE